MGILRDFVSKREDLNSVVAKYAGNNMKRFFGLDITTYQPGAIDRKTKEMLGLVSSLVLRCDDCIFYHLDQLRKMKATSVEVEEILTIGMMVGGSITIPHVRRALSAWDSEEGESK
ncbi:MAG: carboxymuconolactone decarboxylase family protein [Caldisericia bacterium]|nr:carboxymuconolactone decarboxylase family protein [Caldisericia bacterium]